MATQTSLSCITMLHQTPVLLQLLLYPVTSSYSELNVVTVRESLYLLQLLITHTVLQETESVTMNLYAHVVLDMTYCTSTVFNSELCLQCAKLVKAHHDSSTRSFLKEMYYIQHECNTVHISTVSLKAQHNLRKHIQTDTS